MSSHYEWGDARSGNYQLVTRETAPDEWNLPAPDPADPWSVGVTSGHALGLFNANGDGTVLEGDPDEILDYVDLLHAYAHRELDGLVEYDTRPCAQCGDQVLTLSSRDWCDACEAVTIPDEVWSAFLARETLRANEHPGEVALSAVVSELLRMVAERELAGD